MSQTPLALTMGDPAGVGPELALAAWHDARQRGGPTFVVVGSIDAFDDLPGPTVPLHAIDRIEQATEAFPAGLPVLHRPLPAPVARGRPDIANAGMVIAAIDNAVALAQTGRAAAVVTNPIAKHVLQQAGFAHPGHTEYLAHLCGLGDDASVMMLAGRTLRAVPATVHLPLSQVPQALTQAHLRHVLTVVDRDLRRRFGLSAPRIAVTGLNPHAGEAGVLGDEEIRVITPVIEALRADGLDLRGPIPGDSLFHEAARAGYDVAVAMYHDQALIPVKSLDFFGTVNVTLGLPIIRTSPDHGTAFDLAGTGTARPDSLIAALRLAADMAVRDRRLSAAS